VLSKEGIRQLMIKINRRDASEILPGQYVLVKGVWGCIERVNRVQCVVRLTDGNIASMCKRDIGDTFRRDLSGTHVSVHDEKVCNHLSVDALNADIRFKQRLAVYAHNEGRLRSSGQISLVGQNVMCASSPAGAPPNAVGESAASVSIHPHGVDISTDGYVRVDGLLSLNYDLFVPEGSYIYTKHGKKEIRSIRMNGEAGITVPELHVADLRHMREDTSTSIDASGVRTNELFLTGLPMPLREHLAHMQSVIDNLTARVATLERESATTAQAAPAAPAAPAAAEAAHVAIQASRYASQCRSVAATHVATALALVLLATGGGGLRNIAGHKCATAMGPCK
jgi:hypothetical protein